MGSDRVAISIEDGVAHVALARPDKLNAMDKDMFVAIGDSFRALGRDPNVRAILLSGQGRHFSAGLDLDYASRQFPPAKDTGRAAEARLRHIEWLQESFSALEAARLSKDRLGSYLVLGVLASFTFQVVYNITMSAGLAPVKGLTLPLMSYGGSSMIATLAGFGLILNVRMRRFTN